MAGAGPLRGYLTPARAASSAASEALDDHVDLRRADNEGRRQENVVALDAVDRAAHRIDHEALRHRLALDAGVQFQGRIERPLARPVADQLERPEKPAAANVADERVLGEALVQATLEPCAHLDHVGEQPIPSDDVLHRQRRRRGHRMAHIGVAMLEAA